MVKTDGQAAEKKGRESADFDDLLAGSGSSSSPSSNREEQGKQKRQKMDGQDGKAAEEIARAREIKLFKAFQEGAKKAREEAEKNMPDHVKAREAASNLIISEIKKKCGEAANPPPANIPLCKHGCYDPQSALQSKLDGAAPSSGDHVQEKEKKEDMPDSKDTSSG